VPVATPTNWPGLAPPGLAPRVVLVVAGDAAVEDNSPDVVMIRLARDTAGQPGPGECVAAAPMAWEAWRVLAGVAQEQFAGYRAIVDGQGWLRAWLPPDAGSDILPATVRDARDHPVAALARPGGGHRH
jgi:hypothetical protein